MNPAAAATTVNPNQHVTDFLEYYCLFKLPPGYAVLLKGKWGVGKSWFIKKFLEVLKQRNQKYLYVSLYGMASFDDIENEMFKQLHPVLSSKGAVLSGKIFKGLVKTTVKIDLDRDGHADGSVSSQIPDIKIPEYLLTTDGLIMVFDDLERASIPIVSLLGYINHFVEHQGLKIIILANEEELSGFKEKENAKDGDKEDLKNACNYWKIKEKVIGKTFEISPCTVDAVGDFIKEIKSDSARNFFLDNSDLIHERYDDAKFHNLRHLKQALWDFERLFVGLPHRAKENTAFMKDLLSLFLILSFEIKSGELMPSNIEFFRTQYWLSFSGNAKPETDSYYKRLSAKYLSFSYFEMVLEPSFWIEFFDKGIVPAERLEQHIDKSKYFRSSGEPDWKRLWRLIALSEDEFERYLKSVSDDFHLMKFKEVEVVKHVFGVLLKLSSLGLYKKSRAELLEFSYSYINYLKNNGFLRIVPDRKMNAYENEEWDGLGFTDRDSNEFRQLCTHIDKCVDEATFEHYSEAAVEVLKYMNSDLESFIQMITYHQDGQNYYYNIPIFIHIEPEVFVRSYLELPPQNKQVVAHAIQRRYLDSGARQHLMAESNWLSKVNELLGFKAATLNGRISGYQLNRLINQYFSKSLEELNNVNN